MAVAYETNTTAISTSNVTSLAINYPATINANDDLIIIAGVDQDDATSFSASGFALAEEQFYSGGSAGLSSGMLHKVATGSESGSVTVNHNGNDTMSMVMLRYSGSNATTTPPTSSQTQASDSTPGAPGDVLSSNNFMVIVVCDANSNGNQYSSDPTGYTNRLNTGGDSTKHSLLVADQSVTGDGSTTWGEETWTNVQGRNSVCFSIALQEAAAAGGSAAPTRYYHAHLAQRY